ncbi:MAG: glycerol-3-phosphate dehydrogenase/oxidase [Bacteroidia bacterium]|nr:glycerol-3-phosphate dehydrogenase/oxidase [Bacteroidia bacterium]
MTENFFQLPKRSQLLAEIQQEEYDIVVIGGGASGCGVALEAALRGYKVLLIEAFDLAQGASSASTKLVHGGVRYLEKAIREFDYGQYKLVQEALHERVRMLHNAPHLAQPLEIIIPVYRWWETWYYKIGLWLYDLISGDKRWPSSRVIAAKEVFSKVPELNREKIAGGILYYDGQFNDSRYAVAVARAAQKAGAQILSYVACTELLKNHENQVESIQFLDNLTGIGGKIRAKWFINCTGAMADKIRQMARPNILPRLKPSKGVHLVFPKTLLTHKTGVLIPKTWDGRVIFLLPWQQGVLFGTTDTAVNDSYSQPNADQSDIEYLIDYFKQVIDTKFHQTSFQSVFAGNRPLVLEDPEKPTEALIRSHEVEVWEAEHIIHLLGGKWTTYRQMAEDTLNALEKTTRNAAKSSLTESHKLPGFGDLPRFPNSIPADIQQHIQQYGSESQWFIDYFEQYGVVRLLEKYPFTTADVIFACQFEFALTIDDILDRRIRLETTDLRAAYEVAPLVAQILHQNFGDFFPDPDSLANNYRESLQKKLTLLNQ